MNDKKRSLEARVKALDFDLHDLQEILIYESDIEEYSKLVAAREELMFERDELLAELATLSNLDD